MQALIFGFLWIAALAGGQGQQTFIGQVTDSECANANHSPMQMGSTDAECARACTFAHGALYVLYDGDEVYRLSDQLASEEFAGRKVRVTGRLDPETQTIQMGSINAEE